MYFTAQPKANTNFRPWDEMTVEDLRFDSDLEFPRNKLSARDKICFTCPLEDCTTGPKCPLRLAGFIAG